MSKDGVPPGGVYPNPGAPPPPAGYNQPPQGAQQCPPGYYSAPPPQGAPYGAPQGAPPQYAPQRPPPQQKPVQQKKKGGILGSVTSALDSVTKDLSREADLVSNAWNKYAHEGAASEQFGNHNVVQLISRTSGRPLQIVMSPAGHLVVDANGGDGQFNAAWTVVAQVNYVVQLHNNFNYLAARNGNIVIEHYPQGQVPHGCTRFRVIGHNAQFIILENVEDPKSRLGFNKDGSLRIASATGRDDVAHFAVKVVYNAGYGKR